MNRSLRDAAAALLLAALAPPAPAQTRVESLERPGGQRVEGRLFFDTRAGLQFMPRDTSKPILLEPGSKVEFNGPGPDSLAGPPPFRVLVGESLRLSGVLRGISNSSVRLGVRWQSAEVTLPRPGVQAVVQRPGEARLMVDGFETLDPARWTRSGALSLVDQPGLGAGKSLRLPAGGASIAHRLEEPLAAGRLDLAFRDNGTMARGQKWFVELVFQGASGPATVNIALGWSEETLAVESPGGPSLAIQRLARTPGWHRLSLRFGPDQTEISVDGKELAHGKGPEGPLTSVRLASTSAAGSTVPEGLAGHVDDFQIIRFAEPTGSPENDITQDDARLIAGDQLFGEIRQSESDHVVMAVAGKTVSLPWSELSGLFFRRLPAQGTPVEGVLVRVGWRSAPGVDPADLDLAAGALQRLTDRDLVLATPYSGVLTVPRDLLRSLAVLGQGRRLVVDPAAHHLGDEISVTPPLLDPPQPEGDSLERAIELSEVPDRPAFLVLDVTQVEGEDNDSPFSANVRKGELRTYVVVNSKRIDYLNHYIKTRDEAPERVAIPIPRGLLRPGKNTIRLELTPTASKPKQLDDIGVLQIALEFGAAEKPAAAPPRQPGSP
jgi:hypothetical protein